MNSAASWEDRQSGPRPILGGSAARQEAECCTIVERDLCRAESLEDAAFEFNFMDIKGKKAGECLQVLLARIGPEPRDNCRLRRLDVVAHRRARRSTATRDLWPLHDQFLFGPILMRPSDSDSQRQSVFVVLV